VSAYQTREAPRFWLVHVVTAILATIIAIAITDTVDGSPKLALAIGLSIVAAVIILDIARCRAIAIDADGFSVGAQRYAWTDVESFKVREVPIARAGIYVKLTDDARARLHRRPAHYKFYGFGLEAPPTPEQGAERFDIFIRAHRDRLEEIYARMVMREMSSLRKHTDILMAKVGAGNVQARLVVDALESLTVEVVATSLDALLADEGRAVGCVLPEAARWDPAFQGGVMLFVGPMELSSFPNAQRSLDRYKDLVRKQLAGTPRAVEAIFAVRR
jgi:hypothetical protein